MGGRGMTHRRTQGHEDAETGRDAGEEAQAPLTEREERILAVIKQGIRETGVSPGRKAIALGAGYERAHSIETALLSLARKGAIELLANRHHAIRVIDRDEARVIETSTRHAPGGTGADTEGTIDRMPGALVRRLSERADLFFQIQGTDLETLGVSQGDLVAAQRMTEIRTGSVVVARDDQGAWVYLQARVTSSRRMVLTAIGGGAIDDEGTETEGETLAALRIAGALSGVVRARPIREDERRASARQASAGRAAPSPQQAAVLDIIRTHIRQRGIPPSLYEMTRELGAVTTGAIHKHVRGLELKGWIARPPGVQRSFWPTDMRPVPIVDPVESSAGRERGLASGATGERVPWVLAEQFEPRPDWFMTVTKEMGAALGLERGDLIAIEASAQAGEGEIVIARTGESGDIVCGEFRQRDARHQELRPTTDAADGTTIASDGSDGALLIEGVIVGSVTFRDLEPARDASDGAARRAGG